MARGSFPLCARGRGRDMAAAEKPETTIQQHEMDPGDRRSGRIAESPSSTEEGRGRSKGGGGKQTSGTETRRPGRGRAVLPVRFVGQPARLRPVFPPKEADRGESPTDPALGLGRRAPGGGGGKGAVGQGTSPRSSSFTSRAAFSPSSRRFLSIILERSAAALSSALTVQPMAPLGSCRPGETEGEQRGRELGLPRHHTRAELTKGVGRVVAAPHGRLGCFSRPLRCRRGWSERPLARMWEGRGPGGGTVPLSPGSAPLSLAEEGRKEGGGRRRRAIWAGLSSASGERRGGPRYATGGGGERREAKEGGRPARVSDVEGEAEGWGRAGRLALSIANQPCGAGADRLLRTGRNSSDGADKCHDQTPDGSRRGNLGS